MAEMTLEEKLDYLVEQTLAGLEDSVPADLLEEARFMIACRVHAHPVIRDRLVEHLSTEVPDESGERPIDLTVRVAQAERARNKKKANGGR